MKVVTVQDIGRLVKTVDGVGRLMDVSGEGNYMVLLNDTNQVSKYRITELGLLAD